MPRNIFKTENRMKAKFLSGQKEKELRRTLEECSRGLNSGRHLLFMERLKENERAPFPKRGDNEGGVTA
jgi:hypothetical protein